MARSALIAPTSIVRSMKIRFRTNKFSNSDQIAGNSSKNLFIFSNTFGLQSLSKPPIRPILVVKRAPQISS